MKPQANFFLLNRALLEHSWLTKNRNWQLAWIYIIGRASFETGHVNLTEVYRELSDIFESYQWRRFVKRLVAEGMIAELTTVNRGDRIGFEQVAVVANYGKYQGEKSSRKVPERLPEHLPERLPERYDVQDADMDDDALAVTEALPERLPVSNKEYSKEFKELTPPTPPAEPTPATKEGENHSNLLASQHPTVFASLCRIKSIAKANTPQFQAWAGRVLSDCRSGDPTHIEAVLEDMAMSWSQLNLPWAWYAKQLANQPKGSTPSKIGYGDIVYHPEQGEFQAYMQALYEDSWRCPEGHFIPASELQVVRAAQRPAHA